MMIFKIALIAKFIKDPLILPVDITNLEAGLFLPFAGTQDNFARRRGLTWKVKNPWKKYTFQYVDRWLVFQKEKGIEILVIVINM